ncbi:MAG TPA: ATP-binding cassette domain-containing protein [Candidatus Limnocylindria bacterium]|nr:ATP-binding cassette domain-containing protein [Candidatus Limnocylindria bacterium]
MPPAPLVEVDGLTFRYRRASDPAVRDVSLRIDPGDVVLVAGPSGCGKSTLLRAINGLVPHAYSGELTGEVRIDGRRTTELRLRQISEVVGTLLQDPAKQIVGSTVEAELAFGPENMGMPPGDIANRIREVVTDADIGHLVGRETAHLSGGERQLLAMAGALMLRPRCYVVDEPLANLDPATADRLLAQLRALADAGHAVVIVEHRVEEALALRPDRVLSMDDGRVVYDGPVDGFLRVADPLAVKLPFEVVLERARADGLPAAAPAPAVREAGSPRLTFDDVHVSLGERHVLRGIDASLGAREIVAVLGPNGSGKTTLFRTAMGLVRPDGGRVAVDGRDVAATPTAELARSIGYVFQSPSQMLFARTVRQELLFGPRNLGLPLDDPDGLAMDALRRVGLADEEAILDRPPLTLSFGQQKRLALAIGLALRPKALILDEPSAGQDFRTSTAFMREVASIPGLESLYFITHDVDLALTHADRILVIRDGRIVADGPPGTVIEDAELWHASNLHRTSLMTANLAWSGSTSRFLDAPTLARAMVAEEGRARHAVGEGGSSVGG